MGIKDTLLEGLAQLSPVIGMALGGPVGGLIGKGIAVAASTITGKTQPDEILEALTTNPEKLLELEARTADRELEELRIHAADRDSARERETKVGGWANPVLAGIVVGGFFWVVWHVLHDQNALTGATAGIVGTLVGYVSAKADQVVSYYFGSSAGSARKTNLMARFGI